MGKLSKLKLKSIFILLMYLFFQIHAEALNQLSTQHYSLRELADTDFASVQNFVKLGLYLRK